MPGGAEEGHWSNASPTLALGDPQDSSAISPRWCCHCWPHFKDHLGDSGFFRKSRKTIVEFFPSFFSVFL